MKQFVSTIELQRRAQEGGYAVGAFNFNNMEILKCIVAAAVEERSPVIISVTPSAMKYAGAEYLEALARTALEISDVPMALHLDHGNTPEDCDAAMDAGFSTVMIDGSKLPWDGNVAVTKQVIGAAHARGVDVEAELGLVPPGHGAVAAEVPADAMTVPQEAVDFVSATGVDSLAIAIGNAHGWYKGRPELDFDRLADIRKIVDIPIVLHGASGIPDEDIERAIGLGISKINIDTEIRRAFRDGVKMAFEENPDVTDPRQILKPAIGEMTEVVRRKLRLFGSAGKA